MHQPESSTLQPLVDHAFRHASGRMKAILLRMVGPQRFDLVEDAVQDALLQALRTWAIQGVPQQPEAWLIRVAKHKLIDRLRRHARTDPLGEHLAQTLTAARDPDAHFSGECDDERLLLMFRCCGPGLPVETGLTLTLDAVCGFSAAEIARALMKREAAVAQRLVRAKRYLRKDPSPLSTPDPAAFHQRLPRVLAVLYAMFNEGYASHRGTQLLRTDLCDEALLLCGKLTAFLPQKQAPVHALVALMAFQMARFPSRQDEQGLPLRLADQDRSKWDTRLMRLGLAHFSAAASGNHRSRYHLEAEIAFCHISAPTMAATDWQRILNCYDQLWAQYATPVIALNRAVAIGHVQGAEQALTLLDVLEPDLATYAPYHLTRAHFLAITDQVAAACKALEQAQKCTSTAPSAAYIAHQISRLTHLNGRDT